MNRSLRCRCKCCLDGSVHGAFNGQTRSSPRQSLNCIQSRVP
jgi:hypothetical protein